MGKIVRKRKEFGGSSNSAENIMYDATKNVKEAIDETKNEVSELNSNLTELDGRISATKYDSSDNVDLNSYTAETNKYTFPADGYVTIASINGGVGEVIIVSSNDAAFVSLSNIGSQGYWTANTVYVKKGMKCYCSAKAGTLGSNINISFRPLK